MTATSTKTICCKSEDNRPIVVVEKWFAGSLIWVLYLYYSFEMVSSPLIVLSCAVHCGAWKGSASDRHSLSFAFQYPRLRSMTIILHRLYNSESNSIYCTILLSTVRHFVAMLSFIPPRVTTSCCSISVRHTLPVRSQSFCLAQELFAFCITIHDPSSNSLFLPSFIDYLLYCLFVEILQSDVILMPS